MGFRKFCRALAMPMAIVMFLAVGPLPAAQAAMVSTEQLVSEEAASADREKVMEFLEREDVRQEMMALGVDPDEATARAQALSDAEVAEIAGKLDEAKAGQNAIGAIVGAAVLIFLVLLITDLLCLTSVFNFTKCAR